MCQAMGTPHLLTQRVYSLKFGENHPVSYLCLLAMVNKKYSFSSFLIMKTTLKKL